MMTRDGRLNILLLHAAEQVVAAYLPGEIKVQQPKHEHPLHMLANRVKEVHETTTVEERMG